MKDYSAPTVVPYGAIASITGESGTNGELDTFITVNGDEENRGFTGSLDGCASTDFGKCCFPDDQSNC